MADNRSKMGQGTTRVLGLYRWSIALGLGIGVLGMWIMVDGQRQFMQGQAEVRQMLKPEQTLEKELEKARVKEKLLKESHVAGVGSRKPEEGRIGADDIWDSVSIMSPNQAPQELQEDLQEVKQPLKPGSLWDSSFVFRMQMRKEVRGGLSSYQMDKELQKQEQEYRQTLEATLAKLGQGQIKRIWGVGLLGVPALLALLWWGRGGIRISHGYSVSVERSAVNYDARTYRSYFDAFVGVCIRDKNTEGLISEIMQNHDDRIKLHPRTRNWRIWVHCCMIGSLVWHCLFKKMLGLPSRLLEKLIEIFVKIRFS